MSWRNASTINKKITLWSYFSQKLPSILVSGNINNISTTITKVESVDNRTETKIPKFRCFGNFNSVRFGSVRLEKTEPKQIAEFRLKKYTVGKKIEKKSSSKSFSLSLLWVFLCEIEQKWLFIINFAKNGWKFPKINVF